MSSYLNVPLDAEISRKFVDYKEPGWFLLLFSITNRYRNIFATAGFILKLSEKLLSIHYTLIVLAFLSYILSFLAPRKNLLLIAIEPTMLKLYAKLANIFLIP
uniref:Uncharacterized protein n=1 Tax=Glossina austeni TaxID=7395 RepID=A0A1A9V8N6_GLOAU